MNQEIIDYLTDNYGPAANIVADSVNGVTVEVLFDGKTISVPIKSTDTLEDFKMKLTNLCNHHIEGMISFHEKMAESYRNLKRC